MMHETALDNIDGDNGKLEHKKQTRLQWKKFRMKNWKKKKKMA